jgi:uncharacterized protein (DUF2249 family)
MSGTTSELPDRGTPRPSLRAIDGRGGATSGPTENVAEGLTRALAQALRALGNAGEPVTASRLAAQAWVLLRDRHHGEAERLAGVLHYLARLHAPEDGTENPRTETPTDQDLEITVTPDDQQLDVRTEPPARRHELIFDTYAELTEGTAFVLINDHDPKPLYYQLAAEHTGEFTWDYLEEGPEVWRVRIGRVAAADGDSAASAGS